MKTTQNAIAKLKSIENGMNEELIVDVMKPKKLKDNYIAFALSDGEDKFKGIIEATQPYKNFEQIMKRKKISTLRVKITEHITHFQDKEPLCIEIVGFSLADEKSKRKEATPKPLCIQIPEDPQFSFFGNPLEQLIKDNLKQTQNNQALKLKLDYKSDEEQTATNKVSPSQPEQKHQKIVDLYESYYNWVLLVRVIDANYREFTSKMGKHTRILTLQLIDEDGCMISGSYFGDLAPLRQSEIKNGKVYRISKGKVIEDTYNKCKKEMQSKYSLIFSKDTAFTQVENSIYIPLCKNNWLRLSQISQQSCYSDETYNFIGMLIEIQDPVEFQKQEKTIKKETLKIADPITKIVNQAIIWNNQFEVNRNLIGKSVLLKNFKINKYKDQFTLNSTFKSDLTAHSFFAEHEGKCNFNEGKAKVQLKTIQQLSDQLHYQNVNVTTVSNIEVWIKEVGFDKKWFYDACPNPRCKKSCSGKNNSNRCEHCLIEFHECVKKYMLQVVLVDFTGSIEVTAFDESASILLKNMPMQSLFPMTNKQLCIYAESMFCYEQFRIQITSKIDHFGRTKHTINGKPTKLGVSQSIQSNMNAILTLGKQLNVFQQN